MSDLYARLRTSTTNKGQKMTEIEIVENVTKTKCAICGDKLTDWEDTLCIMCED